VKVDQKVYSTFKSKRKLSLCNEGVTGTLFFYIVSFRVEVLVIACG
jgi:hypothetical protein